MESVGVSGLGVVGNGETDPCNTNSVIFHYKNQRSVLDGQTDRTTI